MFPFAIEELIMDCAKFWNMVFVPLTFLAVAKGRNLSLVSGEFKLALHFFKLKKHFCQTHSFVIEGL
jgi:hypothetical protein